MKAKIMSMEGAAKNDIELPMQFIQPIREDLIRKAVLVLQANSRQKYGASTRAGKRHSTEVSKRRRKYRGCYGIGISRVPRKVMSRRGTRMNWVGALAPGTTGGRRAHPPKAEKNWELKINKKENRKAIISALSASVDKAIVEARGHKVPDNYPIVIEDAFEKVNKTKSVADVFKKIKIDEEIKRCAVKTIRAGKGKTRGRPYQKKKGPLLVVSQKCELLDAASNIPGVEVVQINKINAELLAPGTHPGRFTIYTESAIKKLKEEKLFL